MSEVATGNRSIANKVVLFTLCAVSQSLLIAAEPAPIKLIEKFDRPLEISYLSWAEKAAIVNDSLVVRETDNRGGVGYLVDWNLANNADLSLVMRIKAGERNRTAACVVMLKDDKGHGARWEFPLKDAPAGINDFTTVFPRGGASLSEPNAVEEGGKPDLAAIRQIQIMGDWLGPTDMDIEVAGVWLVPPTPAVAAARNEILQKRLAEEAAAKVRQQALIDQYSTRTENSPSVEHIAAVAPNMLAIEIQAGRLIPASVIKYEPQPKDKRTEKKSADGEIESIIVERDGKTLGWLIGPDRQWLTLWESVEGDPLLDFIGDDPETFRVQSANDPAYAKPITPLAVYRKSRANAWAQGPGSLAHRHTYYLKLPASLVSGKTYNINLGQLNTQQQEANFTFDVSTARSEAVHVNQIGYRPDDPIKRAFVSCWLGTGGRLELPALFRFALVDEKSGKKAFQGNGELHYPATKDEEQARTANFNGTDVARCDFSSFNEPGRYRVVVDGIGCSYPFEIGDGTWRHAFEIQMRGLYHQRSGFELGPPYTTFQKPRDMNPADGYKVTRTRYRTVEKGETAWEEFPGGDMGESVPQAAGGYHDAGDWNPRRVTHMRATLATLMILDLFPETIASLKLNIPPEAGIPDILAEALFEFEFFQRIQQADGGVGYGLESKGDPLPGEVSWLNSFPSYVTKGDYAASWYFAAVGARLARLLDPFDAKRAGGIRASAVRAFEFAENDHAADFAAGLTKTREEEWRHIDYRNLAALELYQLTHDEKYHTTFLQDSVLTDDAPVLHTWGKHIQEEHAFVYARLPENLGDAALKKRSITAMRELAEITLINATKNAFNITVPDRTKPQFIGFYTTPDASALVYAHSLTGDDRYLGGIVQSTQFQSGCNPNNWVYTTGLGANPIKNAFKLDARFTGQAVPAGLTPYGNIDFAKWNGNYITWPITYIIGRTMQPNAFAWPTTEAYWDLGGWPMLEEFTVDHWSDNIIVWGYLAERK